MRRLACLLFSMLACLTLTAPARADQTVAEENVKAAFLYRFASFIEWPAETFAASDAPIRICLLGAPAMRPLVERAVAGQQISGHSFEVRTIANVATLGECHILYARGSQIEAALDAARNRPILSVTDGASDEQRGVIHFVVVDDRVRFHIDDALAAEDRLTISSRLLTLAVSVRRRG